jgi:hypothetical protein
MPHPKGVLLERCKRLGLGKPKFDTKSTGPDHDPTFLSDVIIAGEVYGTGQGGSKRDAERHASEEALAYLERQDPERQDPADGPPTIRQSKSKPRRDAFEGPWPLFPEVLVASLSVANSRVSDDLTGEEAALAVQELALRLYKGSLEGLGEVVEVEEEAD